MHSALIELVARPQATDRTAKPMARWMIKLASGTQGVVVRVPPANIVYLTLSGPAWERVTLPISIPRFETLLNHLPSQHAGKS